MLKNMQWRAGLIIMNHARQKDCTVFSTKKSNYSKIGKLYRLCQIKEKVIGESAKYYKALFKKIPKRLPFFQFALKSSHIKLKHSFLHPDGSLYIIQRSRGGN